MTPLDESKTIATRVLDGITPSGARTRIILSLGIPYMSGNSFRCPVRVSGLDYDYTPPDIGGWDAVQALLLAISCAAGLLDDFVVRGGRVFYPDTDTPYDFSDLIVTFRAAEQT
jgi:hypothetical protein